MSLQGHERAARILSEEFADQSRNCQNPPAGILLWSMAEAYRLAAERMEAEIRAGCTGTADPLAAEADSAAA